MISEPYLCTYCKLPIEVIGVTELVGSGFGPPGTECIVLMVKVICPNDHWYFIETDSVEL